MQNYRVVLADDHPMLRAILRDFLHGNKEMEVIGEAGDGLALLQLLHSLSVLPNMVILDLSMPKMHGIEAAREVRKRFPGVKVLVLTAHRDMEYVSRAFTAGASGYLLKEDAVSELFDAIGVIRGGGKYKSQHLDHGRMIGQPRWVFSEPESAASPI